MSASTNLAAVVAKQKAEREAKELAEEAAASASPVAEGLVRVRLTRPFYRDGRMLEGVQELPEGVVPKSAKRL